MYRILLIAIFICQYSLSLGTILNDSLWSIVTTQRIQNIEATIFELAKTGSIHAYHKAQSSAPLNPVSLEHTGIFELRVANHSGEDSSISLNFNPKYFSGIGFYRSVSHDILDGSSTTRLEQISLRHQPASAAYTLSPLAICYVRLSDLRSFLSNDDLQCILALDVVAKSQLNFEDVTKDQQIRSNSISKASEMTHEQVLKTSNTKKLYSSLFLTSLTNYVWSGYKIYADTKGKNELVTADVIKANINIKVPTNDTPSRKYNYGMYSIALTIDSTSEVSVVRNKKQEALIKVVLVPNEDKQERTDFNENRIFYILLKELYSQQNAQTRIISKQVISKLLENDYSK